jgi:hypothetical protein
VRNLIVKLAAVAVIALPAIALPAGVSAAPTNVSTSLASLQLRSCGLQGDSDVRATPNVTCSTAIRVDHSSCSEGSSCHVDGFTCRMRSTGKYTFTETCTRGRNQEILITGGV